MVDPDAAKIAASPNFRALLTRRSRLGWTLAALMMVVYYGFILLVAFDKPLLATPIGDGVTTLGMPIGLAVIVFTVAVTGYYVRRANAEFDELTGRIQRGELQ